MNVRHWNSWESELVLGKEVSEWENGSGVKITVKKQMWTQQRNRGETI